MFIGLRRCGLSVEQASNLTAHLAGIQPVPGGWSLAEVERLRFLRWMVGAGRLGADDVPPRAGRTRRAACASVRRLDTLRGRSFDDRVGRQPGRRPATVDHERLARHEPATRPDQVAHGREHVLPDADPPDRVERGPTLGVGRVIREVPVVDDRSRRNRVDGDPGRRELEREVARERLDAGLGHGVGRQPVDRATRGDRRGQHDPTAIALFDHLSRPGLGGEERAPQVRGHHPVERRRIDVEEPPEACQPGMAAQHVEPAEGLDGGGDQRGRSLRVGEVATDEADPPAGRLDRARCLLGTILVAVIADHDGAAIGGKPLGEDAADPRRSTGDDRDALHRTQGSAGVSASDSPAGLASDARLATARRRARRGRPPRARRPPRGRPRPGQPSRSPTARAHLPLRDRGARRSCSHGARGRRSPGPRDRVPTAARRWSRRPLVAPRRPGWRSAPGRPPRGRLRRARSGCPRPFRRLTSCWAAGRRGRWRRPSHRGSGARPARSRGGLPRRGSRRSDRRRPSQPGRRSASWSPSSVECPSARVAPGSQTVPRGVGGVAASRPTPERGLARRVATPLSHLSGAASSEP